MTTETEESVSEPSFRQKNSSSMRIWHWGTFIAISGSLITVLFGKTLLNAKNNIELVKENLKESNITVTPEQANSLAHEFNDLVWHWHTYIGYVLASLLAFRILFEFFQPKRQKTIPMIKNAWKYLKMPAIDKRNVKHYLFVRYTYLLFYFALIVQACTGLFMAYSDDVHNLKELRNTASEIHSVFMWVIISYIVIHISGVILAELGKRSKGIVSDMINGGE